MKNFPFPKCSRNPTPTWRKSPTIFRICLKDNNMKRNLKTSSKKKKPGSARVMKRQAKKKAPCRLRNRAKELKWKKKNKRKSLSELRKT